MTFEICDRCGKEIVGHKMSFTAEISGSWMAVGAGKQYHYKELCEHCSKIVGRKLCNIIDEFMTVQEDEEEE